MDIFLTFMLINVLVRTLHKVQKRYFVLRSLEQFILNSERLEPFLVTEFNLFLEVSLIPNELEQLELKLKKRILGFRNIQEKLEKDHA